MKRMVGVLVGALSLSIATVASAQVGSALPDPMRGELERLQATSSPALRPVVRDGRVTFLGGLAEPALGPGPVEMARDFLGRHAALAGLDPDLALAAPSTRAHRGTVFVKFDVTRDGLPVLGAQVVVAIRGGLVRRLASSLRPELAAPAALGALIDARDAARAVEAETGRAGARPTRLAWLPLSRELVPVWVVEQHEVAPPRGWHFFVDAQRGAVLDRFDSYQHVDGLVYDPNPEECDFEVSRVELPELTGDGVLEGARVRSFQCGGVPEGDCTSYDVPCRTCGLASHLATADADGNFLYEPLEPDTDDPFAEVQAYYHATRFSQWLEETFGYQRVCTDATGALVEGMDIHVNYFDLTDVASSANSFYGDVNGDGCGDITMGEGLGVDFSYDADVIYHEFAHGVVADGGPLGCGWRGSCEDDLGPDWTALGLNEGYADYFSVAYTDDPELGEHASRAFDEEGSIRDADNDRLCPFDLTGESHADGRIWAGTGWELRQTLGADVTDQLFFEVLLSLAEDAGYAEAAAALLAAADELVEQGDLAAEDRAEVERIVGPEGRRIEGCERIIPLDQIPEGHAEDYMMLFSYSRPGSTPTPSPAGIQFSLTAPRRATSLRFYVEHDSFYDADTLVAHVRKNAPINILIERDEVTKQRTITYTEDFNAEMPDEELVIDGESDPPIEPGTTYHFALAYLCPDGCLLRARGEVEAEPNPFPEADAGADLEAAVGDTVTLDGSGSSDPEGDELAFAWEATSGPAVELDGADGATPSFVVTEPGDYVFTLTVTDLEDASDTDDVTVHVAAEDGGPDGGADGGPDGGDDGDDGGCDCRVAAPRPLAAMLLDLLP